MHLVLFIPRLKSGVLKPGNQASVMFVQQERPVCCFFASLLTSAVPARRLLHCLAAAAACKAQPYPNLHS
jgi:hypothetical protein